MKSAMHGLDRAVAIVAEWLPPILWPFTWPLLIAATLLAVAWDEVLTSDLIIPRRFRK